MADVSKAIGNYISNYLKLNMADIQSAVKSREWFLNRIQNKINERYKEPILYSRQPFIYFGSYFKQTKVKLVDEYDVLIVIDSNTGVFTSGGIEIGEGQGFADPNYKYNSRFYNADGSGISPNKILNWLKRIVEEVTDSFGGEAPERNGQAITAIIKSKNLKIDLVPAGIFKDYRNNRIFYNIPKGNKYGEWIITSPREDIDTLKEVASDKKHFRNIIRLAKRIKDKYNFLVSSFAIETAIVQHFSNSYNVWLNDLCLDTYQVIQYLSKAFKAQHIPDIYNNHNNLILDVPSLTWYANRLDKILHIMEKCYEWESQEKAELELIKAFENES